MALPVNISRIFFIKDPPFYWDISSALRCVLVVIAKDTIIIAQKGLKVNIRLCLSTSVNAVIFARF